MKRENFSNTSNTKTVIFKGLTLLVSYTVYPGDPGMWTLPNGDPGYPPIADEIEVDHISLLDGDLTDFMDNVGVLENLKDLLG